MSDSQPTVSLIVTTYNRPDALELVIKSIAAQSVMPLETIVADDGSKSDTADLISEYKKEFPVPLVHCWQEDDGFRLARSRNLAIARAKGDYIVMVDGDMVLHRHFIRDHLHIAKVNQFVQGRRVILTEEETANALKEKRIAFSVFSAGVKNKPNAISCRWLSDLVSGPFSKRDHRAVRGCNMAFWRDDVLKVNGFNEGFVGWGREDSEFVVRILNSVIERKDLRFGGVAYHLYHKENPRQDLSANNRLLEEAISQKIAYCESGISQHLPDSQD